MAKEGSSAVSVVIQPVAWVGRKRVVRFRIPILKQAKAEHAKLQ